MSTALDAHTRRRVLVAAENTVSIVEEPAPTLEAGEALVRFAIAGVCGSDTHAMHGLHPQMKLPYYPGHEVVGTVEAVGDGVDASVIGRRVTVEPTLPCGECKTCRAGDENVCENLEFFGCGFREGGMADTFTVRADRLRDVPDEFTDEQAILIEPLATPVHAARLAGDLTDAAVLIQGCGTIGLLMYAAARAGGARSIVMSDVLEGKRAKALAAGADAAFDPRDADFAEQVLTALGERADVVFDCVSIQSTIDAAFAVVAKAGTVVTVGVPQKPVTVDLPTLQDRQIRLQGAATYVQVDYDTATEIIRSGAVRADDFVTASYPLEEAAAAFQAATTGEQIKVVVTR